VLVEDDVEVEVEVLTCTILDVFLSSEMDAKLPLESIISLKPFKLSLAQNK